MGLDRLLRCIFVFYCFFIGLVLLRAPWTPQWDLMVTHLPLPGLQLLGAPLLRGALSGFGLVHLVWGLHDFSLYLRSGYTSHDDPEDP